MQCYAIKTQQIEKETTEYNSKYDWELFSNLTFEEKVTEYLKISEMLLMRKRSKHFYFQSLGRIMDDDREERRKKRYERKILQLCVLIDILECVINQMELQIVLLK